MRLQYEDHSDVAPDATPSAHIAPATTPTTAPVLSDTSQRWSRRLRFRGTPTPALGRLRQRH